MQKAVSRLFSQIDLTQKAAKLYLYILSNSPVSETQLRNHFHDTKFNLYIQQLISIPLITFDLDKNRNTIYYALKPDTALKAISDQRLWSRSTSTDPPKTPRNKDSEQFVAMCDEVGHKLLAQYKRRSAIGINSIRIARNSSQLATFLCETISIATSEIFAVSYPPLLPKIALIWNELQMKIQAGIRYKRIVDLWEMYYHGYEIKRRDVMEAGVELCIIEREKINSKFYIIDDNHLILFNPDMSRPRGFILEGQVIKNKALSKKFREDFNELFLDSFPATIVLDYMAFIRDDLLKRAMKVLDDTGVTWLKTLIDYGNFAEWPELPQTKKDIIVEIALKNNLVREDPDFKMGVSPNYSWVLDDIKEYQKATQMSN